MEVVGEDRERDGGGGRGQREMEVVGEDTQREAEGGVGWRNTGRSGLPVMRQPTGDLLQERFSRASSRGSETRLLSPVNPEP